MPDAPVRVLLVDDHQMFAESLARLLGDEEDISILATCASALEATEIAARTRVDVALVDYFLPGPDGIGLARSLKRLDPATQIVMLTGAPDERLLLAAIEAGCSGFLTKERAAAEVASAIRTVAEGEALISSEMLSRLLPKIGGAARSPGSDLTERERELLAYLARGMTNRAIATELFLSVNTVRNYVQAILTKLGAHSKLEAVSIAARAGLVDYGSR